MKINEYIEENFLTIYLLLLLSLSLIGICWILIKIF